MWIAFPFSAIRCCILLLPAARWPVALLRSTGGCMGEGSRCTLEGLFGYWDWLVLTAICCLIASETWREAFPSCLSHRDCSTVSSRSGHLMDYYWMANMRTNKNNKRQNLFFFYRLVSGIFFTYERLSNLIDDLYCHQMYYVEHAKWFNMHSNVADLLGQEVLHFSVFEKTEIQLIWLEAICIWSDVITNQMI